MTMFCLYLQLTDIAINVNVLPLPIVSPLMCLSCHQSIQPRHCHSISYCADDEVCFVERVESNYGVRYNTGCLQRPVCEEQNKTLHIHSNSDGNLAPPTCTECCHTDLCNAQGCGQPGYPRLQERGPVCLACSQLFDNQECREIAHCRNSELCFIKEESEFGDKVYSSGCMPFQHCRRQYQPCPQQQPWWVYRWWADDRRDRSGTLPVNTAAEEICVIMLVYITAKSHQLPTSLRARRGANDKKQSCL